MRSPSRVHRPTRPLALPRQHPAPKASLQEGFGSLQTQGAPTSRGHWTTHGVRVWFARLTTDPGRCCSRPVSGSNFPMHQGVGMESSTKRIGGIPPTPEKQL
eukprot:scaffold25488_cov64-Phaeocystis_antarctica.AAC.10